MLGLNALHLSCFSLQVLSSILREILRCMEILRAVERSRSNCYEVGGTYYEEHKT
jgi:hypothetical protein